MNLQKKIFKHRKKLFEVKFWALILAGFAVQFTDWNGLYFVFGALIFRLFQQKKK